MEPDPLHVDPDDMLVVDAHNGPETWTGAQWNNHVDRARRTEALITVRFLEFLARVQ